MTSASTSAVFPCAVLRAAAPSTSITVPLVYTSSTLLRAVVHCSARRPSAAAPAAAAQPPSGSSHGAATRLYIRGLSFRTTEESLRDAFERFGQLVEVNLVMDGVAKRPRGFAFLSYANEDGAKNAMEGMHGKFLDGRVIFVEFARRKV